MSERDEIVVAYGQTFSTPEGKIVLDDLRRSYQQKSSHVPGDSHSTAFKEGCRSVVLDIMFLMAEAGKVMGDLSPDRQPVPVEHEEPANPRYYEGWVLTEDQRYGDPPQSA